MQSFRTSSLFCNTFPQSGISRIALRGAILLAFSCHGQQRPASPFHSYQHPETLFLFTKVLLFLGWWRGRGTFSHYRQSFPYCSLGRPSNSLQTLHTCGDPNQARYPLWGPKQGGRLRPLSPSEHRLCSGGPPSHRQAWPRKGLFMPAVRLAASPLPRS